MDRAMKIRLTGFISVPADRLDIVRAALPDHIRLTLAEPGCVSFDVTEDPDVPGRFNVAEIFADRVSFDAHQSRMKSSPWAKVTAGIAREYQITKLPD